MIFLNNQIMYPLIAQLVKNLPAMQKTRVQFLGWEDPLEEGMQLTPVVLPGEFHGQRNLMGYSPWGHKESNMNEHLILYFQHLKKKRLTLNHK